MKIDAKAFGKKNSVNSMCGSITFKAESEVDAVQLAALFNGWRNTEYGRVRQLRQEALDRYCRENNVTITID
jgi:hypothetical protein